MTIDRIERIGGIRQTSIMCSPDPKVRIEALMKDYLADLNREYMDVASGLCDGKPAVLFKIGDRRHVLMADEALALATGIEEGVHKFPESNVNDDLTDLIIILRHVARSALECSPQLTSSSSASSSAS